MTEFCNIGGITNDFQSVHEDDQISIAGEELTMGTVLGRTFAGLITVGLGAWLLTNAGSGEEGTTLLIVGSIGVLIAIILPFNYYEYLDFKERNLVKLRHYAGFPIGAKRRPLEKFNRIVLRHLCREESEGGETFTGSVGLKGDEKEPVLWVKHFPASSEGFPAEASIFAEELAKRTGLQVNRLGESL